MKYLRASLIIFASAMALARAQEANQDEEHHAPPIEIPDFSNLDEYIYEPRSTVTVGFRFLSGTKTSFSGHGSVLAPEYPGPNDATTPNINRQYHDGSVGPDTRSTSRNGSNGNGILDPGGASGGSDPIPSDGKTNSWTLSDPTQVGASVPNGFVAFHSYSADVTDNSIRHKSGVSNSGIDVAMSRDMGKFWKGRISWSIVTGVSMNDISSRTTSAVQANVRTVTDLYSLYGQNIPADVLSTITPNTPFISPRSGGQPLFDANGSAIVNPDGSAQTAIVDQTILISNKPVYRTDLISANAVEVVNQWHVKGAYMTFRAGPQLIFPITSRFRAELSAGAVLVYSGSTYDVTQTFTPDLGAPITEVDTDTVYRWRPGYFADASLQFDLTDKAGFFAGAVYQSSGSYTQTLDTSTAKYATKIDLSNENGVRAGMSIRF